MNHKTCVVISGPTFLEAQRQIMISHEADAFELRTDLLSALSQKELLTLRQAHDKDCILTIRSKRLPSRELLFQTISYLQPSFLDLERETPTERFLEIKRAFPDLQMICSVHDYHSTPVDLEELYEKMQEKAAHCYKIATTANSTLDSMRMLLFVKEKRSKGENVTGMCMGAFGQMTRVLGPVFGNAFTYACPDLSSLSAAGQLELNTLKNRYQQRKLNSQTQVYGLIGDPVEQSKSDHTHNKVFQALESNAVYLKMVVRPSEIAEFLKSASQLNFAGVSVTMPLKEIVTSYVQLQSNLASVNTLHFSSCGIQGLNTDGIGAVKALKRKTELLGKHVVILGAGGAAKAIVQELSREGAILTILNRTKEKAMQIAHQYDADGGELAAFPKVSEKGYDILINCTSVGMGSEIDSPVDTTALLPNKIVMEIISVPQKTALVLAAEKRDCQIIFGYEMFLNQALEQFKFWLPLESETNVRTILEEALWTSL